jgi:hypothetical protein
VYACIDGVRLAFGAQKNCYMLDQIPEVFSYNVEILVHVLFTLNLSL